MFHEQYSSNRPSRQPTMVDPNKFFTFSANDTNDTSPRDGSINRADVSTVNPEFDLSPGSVLNGIGMQRTYPMLSNDFDDIYDMDDIYLQSTCLHRTLPTAEITQHTLGECHKCKFSILQF